MSGVATLAARYDGFIVDLWCVVHDGFAPLPGVLECLAEQALAKILAGASLVQLYSAFAYQGPLLLPRLKAGLAALLRARGYANVAEAVGAGA